MEPPSLKRHVCPPLDSPIRLGQELREDGSCPPVNRHLEVDFEPIVRSIAPAARQDEAGPTGLYRIDLDLGDLHKVATGLV
jgi:hypothetical protein